jgi:hypothetical protein
MKRDDYKAVKRMCREEMARYLQRVYQRGYRAGLEAAVRAGTGGGGKT